MGVIKLFLVSLIIFSTPLRKSPIKVACVGDSVTEGNLEATYPNFLQGLLGNKYLVRNFGAGGRAIIKKADFPYWGMPQFTESKEFSPNIVIINFGLNDTKPQNWQYGADFKKDYIALIRTFRTLKSHPKVFIVIPTPLVLEERFGLTQFVLENEIIPQIKQISKLKHVPLINLHIIFEDKPELQPDYIHPNVEGMSLIARKVYRSIIKIKDF